MLKGIKITDEGINAFLEITGDKNDIHSSKYSAEQMGFKDVVAPGMYTGPLMLYSALSKANIGDVSKFNYLRFVWKAPVYRQDTLNAQMLVNEDDISLKVKNQTGKDVMDICCKKLFASGVQLPEKQGKEHKKVISRYDISKFLDIMQHPVRTIKIPTPLISAFVPPALLEWAETGLHMMQENVIYSKPEIFNNPTVVSTAYLEKQKKVDKGYVCIGKHACKINGKVVQAGRVMCLTDKKIEF